MLTFKPYEEVKDAMDELERLVEEGNTSMSNLTRALNKTHSISVLLPDGLKGFR